MKNALHRGMNIIFNCIEYGPLYLCQNLVLWPWRSVPIPLLQSERGTSSITRERIPEI